MKESWKDFFEEMAKEERRDLTNREIKETVAKERKEKQKDRK